MKYEGVHQIPGTDMRLVLSCFSLLHKRGLVPSPIETAQEGARIINKFIQEMDGDQGYKNQYAKDIESEAKQLLTPLNELSWIKENERACFWVWITISRSYFFASPSHPYHYNLEQNPPAKPINFYKNLPLQSITSNSDDRFENIIQFFDSVPQPKIWRKRLLKYLKEFWAIIYNERKPFPWLNPNDSEQCEWAWNFISNTNNTYSTPNIDGILPINQKEKYLAVYAAYDCWNAPSDSKKLFSHNFNKAWHQKKHRDSRQGKKVCNFVLHEDVKRKLDQMADERRISRNRLVEMLIDNEYSNKTLD
jgi:hypothetical protein